LARTLTVVGSFLVGAILVVPGFAGVITASGAGGLPGTAEDLTGVAGLSGIVGTIDSTLGVSMFEISIPYPSGFAAYTTPVVHGATDTELMLFDVNGFGVMMNDDAGGNGAGSTLSCLPSLSAGVPCLASRGSLGPLTPGNYYLAVTFSANLPLSNSGEIFSPVQSTDVVGPDLTQGGADPVTGWDGGFLAAPDFDNAAFDIVIQDTPEPATGILIGIAGLALFYWKTRNNTVKNSTS
jgi:hypothetical protein